MIALRGIQKRFSANGVLALDQAEFRLRPGEIHALLGENGAGKSTLMHIMAGFLRPDAGSILIEEKEVRFSGPAAALTLGIGMVRQHPNLVEGLTVWEDCILGAEPRRGFLLNRKAARERIAGLSERWGFGLDINARASRLTVSQRQKAAVLALLARNARFLIFDEPAAVLTPAETQGLFTLFRALKAEGKAVALISHKLDETLALADAITVLRRGKTIADREAAFFSGESLRSLMFGGGEPLAAQAKEPAAQAKKPAAHEARRPPASRARLSTVKLVVENLEVRVPGRPFIRGVRLEVCAGAILGIAGVRDSGLETLELTITGLLRPAAGRILLQGRDITGKGIRAFREAGGGYLGADRLGSALAPALPIRDSLIIHAHRRARRGVLGRFGIMDRRFLDEWTAGIMDRAGVRVSPQDRAGFFSGGMLQRLILAREFAEDASLLVMAEPGWGLDGPGRVRLHETLREYAASGGAVLLFSTDMDELLALADEIAALRNGVLSRLERPPARDGALLRERIGRAMVGTGAGYA
ncbi:MAG: ATP-binding cassette domain-containing protein [Treponema sp.]|jgi:simple sugar transport system ATP-binding protein|nr:ATP-binding cassette domain-containing protein [Treponema sp.]